MHMTIDGRNNGFRVRWQDGRGGGSREMFHTSEELLAFLNTFNYATAQSAKQLAQTFASAESSPAPEEPKPDVPAEPVARTKKGKNHA